MSLVAGNCDAVASVRNAVATEPYPMCRASDARESVACSSGRRATVAEPICPICCHEIQPIDRVSTQHGELLHFLCYTGIPPLPSFLGRNLAQQRERPFCLPCLGEEFGLTEREVRDAVPELSSTRRFRV